MELPSDIALLEIEVPAEPLVLAQPASDPERLRSCIAAVADRLSAAESAAILVDLDVDRFGVAAEVTALAAKTRIPVAVSSTAKAVIDETFPFYAGVYNGMASPQPTLDAMPACDCLLTVGYRPIEVTTGDFTVTMPASTIHLHSHSVDVGNDNYQAVTLAEVLRGVVDAVPQRTDRVAPAAAQPMRGPATDGSAALTRSAYWQAVQDYLRSGDVVLVDNGTSYALFGLQLPAGCTFVGSVNWGSIGFSVAALLGTLTAAPDRRHLLFVGDGSFQITAQELSTVLRHDHTSVVFLINNGGYTIERGYLGKTESYNDVANWAYADLPKVLRPDTTARSYVARTPAELQNALSMPNDRLIFIESVMDRYDSPAAVTASSNRGAELDYGPRGPQHFGGTQLTPV